MTLKRSGFVLALAGLIASGCGGQGPATSSAPPPATAAGLSPTNALGTIERLDPALDALVAPGAVIEKPVPADFPTADRISVRGEIPIATPR